MTTIKLNNYYPHLTECITLEVSEEIAVTLSIGGRMCDSYKRRKTDLEQTEKCGGEVQSFTPANYIRPRIAGPYVSVYHSIVDLL